MDERRMCVIVEGSNEIKLIKTWRRERETDGWVYWVSMRERVRVTSRKL